MDALVTGGAGFIGSHLVDALVGRGDRVRVLDDLSTGRRENVNPGAELVEGSVADAGAVARAVAGVEVVFHLGALGAVARSVADPRASNTANVVGTLNVLTEARDAGARRIVFASSSSVYGGAEVVPTPESTPLRPRSPYANTKLAGEWYVRMLANMLPGFRNKLAHGSAMLAPSGKRTLALCCDLINQLFRLAHTKGDGL